MYRFAHVFAHPHVVLPVIHVTSREQVLRNAAISRDAQADGIFLINHSISSKELLSLHSSVVDAFPDWWIGVNCLDLHPVTAIAKVSSRVAGVWVDNALIQEDQEKQPDAQAVLESRKLNNWKGLYFGGVAFKYQRHVDDLRSAVMVARNYMDVVTTSGPGTGRAAHIEKIRIMKEALDCFPLAIASGITPENVKDYLPISDCYLVATGISRNFEELDAPLVQGLVETVRNYDFGR